MSKILQRNDLSGIYSVCMSVVTYVYLWSFFEILMCFEGIIYIIYVLTLNSLWKCFVDILSILLYTNKKNIQCENKLNWIMNTFLEVVL